MEKFEFQDFYRFCVSLGLALMLLSMLIPWALIRETGWVETAHFGHEDNASIRHGRVSVQVPTDLELDKRSAAFQRAHLVSEAYDWVAFVSISVGILGLISFFYGLVKWRARQIKRDARENAEIDQILDAAAPRATAEAVSRKAGLDVSAIDDSSVPDDQAAPKSGAGPSDREEIRFSRKTAQRSQEVEQQVLELIERDVTGYVVRRERQLGRTVADAIMASNRPGISDIVIEIKWIRRGFKVGWLLEVIQRVSMMVDLYAVKSDRSANGVLIVVVENHVATNIDFAALETALFPAIHGAYSNVSVKIVAMGLVANGALAGTQLANFENNVKVILEA